MAGIPSAHKRQAILDAAVEAFLQSGYSASVDEIAAAAGVGKQTVYRHFGDKQALFAAALSAARQAAGDPSGLSIPQTGDPVRDLTRIGERILASALSPTLAALHRLTVAEAANHPELARHWGEGAAPFLEAGLTEYFRKCDQAGILEVHEPEVTARQFAYLLITEGRMAGAYGTRPLGARRRTELATRTADLIVRAHSPAKWPEDGDRNKPCSS